MIRGHPGAVFWASVGCVTQIEPRGLALLPQDLHPAVAIGADTGHNSDPAAVFIIIGHTHCDVRAIACNRDQAGALMVFPAKPNAGGQCIEKGAPVKARLSKLSNKQGRKINLRCPLPLRLRQQLALRHPHRRPRHPQISRPKVRSRYRS